MARVSAYQTNFAAGEWSPRLRGRSDLAKYSNALQRLENMIVWPHGGAARRGGTRFVSEVKTSANKTRLVRFEFSVTQAYILEFGDLYVRFYANNGVVESGGLPVEIVTPYTLADVFELQFAQSADTLYITHEDYAPRKLTRTSATAFSLTTIDFRDGPYRDSNTTTAHLIKVSAGAYTEGTTGATMTASGTGNTPFLAAHVGTVWRLVLGTAETWVKVTAYTSSTVVTVTLMADVPVALQNVNTSLWSEGAWGAVRGYPALVSFFEERLWFAGSVTQPQHIWASVTADFENMSPGTNDDDGIVFRLGANEVNVIRWLLPLRGTLLLGTVGGEWTIKASGDAGITPSNITVKLQTARGSKRIAPVAVDSTAMFIQRAGTKLRGLNYSFQDDAFVSSDLTLFAQHFGEFEFESLAYQQEPNSILWLVRADGALCGLSWESAQEVLAWHRHILGGAFGVGSPVVESVATISNGTENQLWLIVKRTVNGATKRYVEYYDETLMTDCALTYAGAAATTVTGLGHLEGETVKVKGDGAVYPDAVVVGGSVTIEGPAATLIEIGLGYISTLQTMPIDAGSQSGAARGHMARVHQVSILLLDSLGFAISADGGENFDQIPFRSSADPMGEEPALFTGVKRVTLPNSWGDERSIIVKQEQPLPLNVLGLVAEVTTND